MTAANDGNGTEREYRCQACGAKLSAHHVQGVMHRRLDLAANGGSKPCGPVRMVPLRWLYFIVAHVVGAKGGGFVNQQIASPTEILDISQIREAEALLQGQIHVPEGEEPPRVVVVFVKLMRAE